MTEQAQATKTTCELCGGDEFEPLLTDVVDYITGQTFSIRRCVRCRFCMTHPLPGDDVIANYYPPRYRTERQKFSGKLRVKLRAAAVEAHVSPARNRRLLDLGCGTGAFAVAMQRRGWQTAVTELNDSVLEQMCALGMEAKLPDAAMREGFSAPFDAITCWHVMEHVEHPLALAQWAREHLAPGGIFQITVPNLSSWQAQLFGRHWQHLDVPRHRYHFTPGTLARLLIGCGFEIIHSTSFALEYDLSGVVQSTLNTLCTRPNVLYEKITARNDSDLRLPGSDLLLSFALAPLIGVVALPLCAASIPVGRGATLTVTCKARDGQ